MVRRKSSRSQICHQIGSPFLDALSTPPYSIRFRNCARDLREELWFHMPFAPNVLLFTRFISWRSSVPTSVIWFSYVDTHTTRDCWIGRKSWAPWLFSSWMTLFSFLKRRFHVFPDWKEKELSREEPLPRQNKEAVSSYRLSCYRRWPIMTDCVLVTVARTWFLIKT